MIADRLRTTRPAEPDTELAVGFLAQHIPVGRLSVAAIEPDGPLEGVTFTMPIDQGALSAWIHARQGRKNLYWNMNEPKPKSDQVGKGGKLREIDIERVRGVALDIDPDPQAELEPGGFADQQVKLLKQAESLDTFWGGPSAVVHTGGGIQAFYFFPQSLPADMQTSREVKAQARGLIAKYGSDAIQNLDRLLRIPFTVNVPDRRKRARGRQPAVAYVLKDAPHERLSLPTLACIAEPSYRNEPAEAAAAFDCSEAMGVLGAPEGLPAPLRAKLAAVEATSQALRRALNPDLAAEHFGSTRSGRDFAIAAALRDDGGFTKLEAAFVIAAYSPEKVEERGETYLAATVQNAWARVKPAATATDYFDADAARETETTSMPPRPAGLVSVSGLIDPQTIPPRDYLIFPRLPLGIFSLLVGEPAISKSTLMLRDALVVATGCEHILRGKGNISPERLHRTGPVIVYNAEDDPDEMRGRLRAMQSHFGVTAADMRHEIHLWSGTEESLVLMRREAARGPLVRAPGANQLASLVRDTRAMLVVLDPFASLFAGADENDTGDMERVSTMLANEAARLRVSLAVAHHTAKSTRDHAGDQGAGRGSFSIVAKARAQATLCAVDADDAKRWGVEGRDVIRLDTGKASYGKRNRAPILLERLSVEIGNGTVDQGPADSGLTAAGQERRMRGGSAPVLVALKMGLQERAPAEVKAEKRDNQRSAIAQAVCGALGERTSAPLAEVLHDIGKRLQDAKVTTASGRDTITNLVKTALAGDGVPIEQNGQIVCVRIFQNGTGKTAPWTIELSPCDAEAGFRAFLEGDNTEGKED